MTDLHKHCPVCSTPIPLSETTCSDKCQNILDSRKTQINKSKSIVYLIMGVLIIAALIMLLNSIYQIF